MTATINPPVDKHDVVKWLYDLYGKPNDEYGDPILIQFGDYQATEDDISFARKFASKMRHRLGKYAKIEQRNSKVVITPVIAP